MIVIPSKKINITASNVLADTSSIMEYVSGSTHTLNALVKITELTLGTANSYVGHVYKSLTSGNVTAPAEHGNLWVWVGYLSYDETRVYPANASVIYNGQMFISTETDNDTSPMNSDSKWKYLKEDNINACTDYYFTTVTRQVNDDLVMEMQFPTSDTLSMFGIFGSSLKIEQLDVLNHDAVIETNGIAHTDPASITDFATWLRFGSQGIVQQEGVDVGTQEFALVDTSSIHDFASYLQFTDCGEVTSVSVELIPAQTQKIRVTIGKKPYKNMSLAEVATVTVGVKQKIACTTRGTKKRRLALTPPVRDKWGEVKNLGDDYVQVYTTTLSIRPPPETTQASTVDFVDAILDRLFNQPVVYQLTDDTHKSFNTFGMMQDDEISLDNASQATLPMKIESFKYKRNTKEC